MLTAQWDAAGGQGAAVSPVARYEPDATSHGGTDHSSEPAETAELDGTDPATATSGPDPHADAPAASAASGGQATEPAEPGPAALLTEISAAVRQLADSSERYHSRAEQREAVIDHQREEVDRLRRGERRSLLRPLLVETCRLRNDLLRQASELPADFDAERAVLLLRSYAESVEITLENSGVRTFAPEAGDPFDPRMHRRVGGQPTDDRALAGRVVRVSRDGYLDADSNSPLVPAEVVVYANPAAAAPGTDQRNEP